MHNLGINVEEALGNTDDAHDENHGGGIEVVGRKKLFHTKKWPNIFEETYD